MNKILIIDDEAGIRSSLSLILEDEGYAPIAFEDAPAGIAFLEGEEVPIVLLDVWMPKMGGIDALKIIKERWPNIEVIIISGHANVDMAVKAVKCGAFDFLEKPLSLDRVLTVVRNAINLHDLRRENVGLKRQTAQDELIGSSEPMQAIKQIIAQSGKTEARILIGGENGTGKELVARAIHFASTRADGPFIEVNCAAIPETLIESELFGHEKGAFTDAHTARKGRFELATGGSLFLDEIGDMSLAAQAKVLRAIQEQEIQRIGGEKLIPVDVRIIAASNKDLKEACLDGSFREDLYFRLNVIPIRIPALRQRPEDISELLTAFLAHLGHPEYVLDHTAIAYLENYAWPGNVRELRNLAERITVLAEVEHLTEEDIKPILHYQNLTMGQGPRAISQAVDVSFLQMPFSEAKEAFEKRYIENKLQENNNIISKTAEAIGMYPSNLHAKLKKLGIKV